MSETPIEAVAATRQAIRDAWQASYEAERERADVAEARAAAAEAIIQRVESLADVVRRLQETDPDTGDRTVSFFALMDALDPDDPLDATPEDR